MKTNKLIIVGLVLSFIGAIVLAFSLLDSSKNIKDDLIVKMDRETGEYSQAKDLINKNFALLGLLFVILGFFIQLVELKKEKNNVKDEKISDFFECLGEIWRDITAIEFFMRCILAKHNGELDKFPKPPYTKGKIYKNPPSSFLDSSFGNTVKEFNKLSLGFLIPDEIVQLRHAMAHGLIMEVNKEGFDRLIKFIRKKEKIKVEFNMPLKIQRLAQIRQSMKELRRHMMKELGNS